MTLKRTVHDALPSVAADALVEAVATACANEGRPVAAAEVLDLGRPLPVSTPRQFAALARRVAELDARLTPAGLDRMGRQRWFAARAEPEPSPTPAPAAPEDPRWARIGVLAAQLARPGEDALATIERVLDAAVSLRRRVRGAEPLTVERVEPTPVAEHRPTERLTSEPAEVPHAEAPPDPRPPAPQETSQAVEPPTVLQSPDAQTAPAAPADAQTAPSSLTTPPASAAVEPAPPQPEPAPAASLSALFERARARLATKEPQ